MLSKTRVALLLLFLTAPAASTAATDTSQESSKPKASTTSSESTSGTLPLVIPHPQLIRKVGGQRLILGEDGLIRTKTLLLQKGDFFDEAATLIDQALKARKLTEGSQLPATTIVLMTPSSVTTPLPEAPVLTAPEAAVLARSGQAYVIRVQPGAQAKVWVIGASPIGAYYGAATLVQLLTPEKAGTVTLPCVEVQDYPDIPARMCADWVLAADWEINGYDWGDGLEAFLALSTEDRSPALGTRSIACDSWAGGLLQVRRT